MIMIHKGHGRRRSGTQSILSHSTDIVLYAICLIDFNDEDQQYDKYAIFGGEREE